MNTFALFTSPARSYRRAARLAFLALTLCLCGTGAAQQPEKAPAKLEVGATYICVPSYQGTSFRIKVSEIDGMWVKGETSAYTEGVNIKVYPSGGPGWVNLRNVFLILEEKR